LENDRDILKNKLSESARKFEDAFKKQEEIYENKFYDFKDKNKRMKNTLIEERKKHEVEKIQYIKEIDLHKQALIEAKDAFDNQIEILKSELNKERQDNINKCNILENDHNRYINDLKNKSQVEINNLQTQYQTILESKLQDCQNELKERTKRFEQRENELKNKIDSYQNLIDND